MEKQHLLAVIVLTALLLAGIQMPLAQADPPLYDPNDPNIPCPNDPNAPPLYDPNDPLVGDPDLQAELQIPGRVEGTGTYFEVNDSNYLNVTLQSSEPVRLSLETAVDMIA